MLGQMLGGFRGMLGRLRLIHLACFLEYRVLPDARTTLAFCAHLAFMLAFFGLRRNGAFLHEMQHRAALPRCKRSGFSLTRWGFRLSHNGVWG